MAELIERLQRTSRLPGPRVRDLGFSIGVGSAAALVLGLTLTWSLQAACALTLLAAVIALYQYNREWGIMALFALWFVAPGVRRVFGLSTGYIENDPLSLVPFLATAALAGLELLRLRVPTRIRGLLIMAAAGFAIGLPVGLIAGPASGVFALCAYVAGIAGAVLGLGESSSDGRSTLRSVLLFGMVPVAAYAVLQSAFDLPRWDRSWLDTTGFGSIGIEEGATVRVFSSLNSPGTLAALLGLSLLCYLTVRRGRLLAVAGAALVAVALALTFVRSAWIALFVAAAAHVIASRGQSARLVLPAIAIAVTVTLALAPVNSTAQDVVERFNTITDFSGDTSTRERRSTFLTTFPEAAATPFGRGLGSAGEPSKLTGESELRASDNGYLALIYQTGPLGFVLVMAAVVAILAAGWQGAHVRGPGQELRLLLFSMLVYLTALLATGDVFYGVPGVIFWFIGGQVLAYAVSRRAVGSPLEQHRREGGR